MNTSSIKRLASLFLSLVLATAGLQANVAQAAMVSNDQIAATVDNSQERREIRSLLAREEVRSELSALGVDPENAMERVDRMTESEINQLSQKIQDLPAGGDALGVVVLVLVIFIILDAAGATDVFPGV